MQAERKITYRCKTRERNDHIRLAVAYGKEALEAAKETGQPIVVARVEQEITFTRGREVLLGLRDRDDPVLDLARHEAIRRIRDALNKMRSLDQEWYEKYNKEAEEHWIRRLDDSGATSSQV